MSKALDKILKDAGGYRYKYPQRSCKECKRHPCFIGQDNIDCDFAKYGCCDYKNS